METWRPNPLEITQDSSCVTWDKLVALRTLYNTIWDRLDACGLAEGNKYGDVSTNNKQEISPLPTAEGFIRLSVATSLSGDTYVSTPESAVFILTDGTLSPLLNDNSYTYLGTTFHMVLKDPCNNCSKFFPTSRTPASTSIVCPIGSTLTLYDGLYALDLSPSPEVCGINLDWSDADSIFEDHIELFDSVKVATDSFDDCYEIKASCCSLFSTAHYEAIEVGGVRLFLLKYIDMFVEGDGITAGMQGFLTTLITASDLQGIIDRVSSDLSHFALGENYICDKCGISPYYIYPNPEDCTISNIACTAPLDWWTLLHTEAVSGYGTAPFGMPDGCYGCSEIGSDGGFETDAVICTCDWEQLASVMSFIIDHCCVLGCTGGTKCPTERDVTVSIKVQTDIANASNCGIFNEDDNKYYLEKQIAHTGINCHCYGSATLFNCDYTEKWEQQGSRTAACSPGGLVGQCDEIVYTVTPRNLDGCLTTHCGSPTGPDCGTIPSPSPPTWTDPITKAEVTAAALSYLGGTGPCASTETDDYGVTNRIKCKQVIPMEGYSGPVDLTTFFGEAERDESVARCYLQRATLTIALNGADVGVETITLLWDETVTAVGGGVTTTTHSQVFSSGSSWTITIVLNADDQTTKVASNFRIE